MAEADPASETSYFYKKIISQRYFIVNALSGLF